MRTFPGKTHDLKPENTPCAQYNQKESTEQKSLAYQFFCGEDHVLGLATEGVISHSKMSCIPLPWTPLEKL